MTLQCNSDYKVVTYNAPFFTTWFITNWTVLFFPLYFITSLTKSKCKSGGKIISDSFRNFREKGFTAGNKKSFTSRSGNLHFNQYLSCIFSTFHDAMQFILLTMGGDQLHVCTFVKNSSSHRSNGTICHECFMRVFVVLGHPSRTVRRRSSKYSHIFHENVVCLV